MAMPFAPLDLPSHLKNELEIFANQHDFVALYKEYRWENDTWDNGFPDILRLEVEVRKTAKNNFLTKENIIFIAKWGNLRNIQRVKCPKILKLILYKNDKPNEEIRRNPLEPLLILQKNTRGLGPTYLSKVLRFALPSEFGAIDTRIVRVVGNGDSNSKQQSWLYLKVRNDGYGWYIPKNQSAWPKDYSRWINILRFFAQLMNNSGKPCPHPKDFVTNGLRTAGVWTCADIEMVIFSYASKHLV